MFGQRSHDCSTTLERSSLHETMCFFLAFDIDLICYMGIMFFFVMCSIALASLSISFFINKFNLLKYAIV
jgi:hypothetical protein